MARGRFSGQVGDWRFLVFIVHILLSQIAAFSQDAAIFLFFLKKGVDILQNTLYYLDRDQGIAKRLNGGNENDD